MKKFFGVPLSRKLAERIMIWPWYFLMAYIVYFAVHDAYKRFGGKVAMIGIFCVIFLICLIEYSARSILSGTNTPEKE